MRMFHGPIKNGFSCVKWAFLDFSAASAAGESPDFQPNWPTS